MFGYLNLNEIERDKFIHRIMPLRRLKDILQNKQLGLLNPKMWEDEDPYENFLMNQEISLKTGKKVSYRETTKNLFGLCLTFNSNSDYAWKVYSQSSNKGDHFVQIKTKPKRIISELDYLKNDANCASLQLGKVQYLKWERLKKKYENQRQ
jgi:hypothetical protein